MSYKESTIPKKIAGPCSAESREQIIAIAEGLKAGGHTDCMRAGVWKPRTRPNMFEGVGEVALEWLCEAKERTGLPIICEVATPEHIDKVLEYGLDGVWIGARTTVNPFYVQDIADRLSGTDLMVMVKNPVSPDLQIWAGAIERFLGAGVTKLAAIHRGFTSTGGLFRNDPRWSTALEFRSLFPDIPIICDPSHIAGKRSLVPIVAQKAIDLDMYGLMIEVHNNPDMALSDAAQQLTPESYNEMMCGLCASSEIPKKGEQMRELAMFRSEVDMIDEELMKLLARRMNLSKDIGAYKRENGIKILQLNRWEQMLNNRIALGESLGIRPELVTSILELLHKASVEIQSEDSNKSEK